MAYEYANQLASRGHLVSVIHPRFMRNIYTSRSPLRKFQTAAVNARNVLAPRSGLQWQSLEKSVRILHVSEPTAQNVPDADVVVATAWQTAEYVVEYPKQKGRKFYIVMDFDPWIASKDVLEKTWNWPLRKITISSWLYDKVRAAGCPATEVTNIPIGINFDQFQLLCDISNRPKRILMLYSTSKSKGSDDGLKALQKCKERHPDLDVVLFGPTTRFRPSGLPEWAAYKGTFHNDSLLSSSMNHESSFAAALPKALPYHRQKRWHAGALWYQPTAAAIASTPTRESMPCYRQQVTRKPWQRISIGCSQTTICECRLLRVVCKALRDSIGIEVQTSWKNS